MAKELNGKVAIVTGATSGIGLASAEAMLAAGANVAMVSFDEDALKKLHIKYGNSVIPIVMDLLDDKACASLIPQVLEKTGKIDILHANAGIYIGGNLVEASNDTIDRMLKLDVNVVIKNVRDVLPHMIENKSGDVIITASIAGTRHPNYEPVYGPAKTAVKRFAELTRTQVCKYGIRMGSISPGPVETALVADWEPSRLEKARAEKAFLDPKEVADVIMFMLTRPAHMTISDVEMTPTKFDLI